MTPWGLSHSRPLRWPTPSHEGTDPYPCRCWQAEDPEAQRRGNGAFTLPPPTQHNIEGLGLG